MTKFDYKKWVTENKHGKIKEQIGDDTIGDDFVVGGMGPIGVAPNSASFCPAGTSYNTPQDAWGAPPTYCGSYQNFDWGESAPDTWIQQCCAGSIEDMGPTVTASTTSDAWTGAAGGTATDFTQGDFDFNTDCTNFNNLPQDFQDSICNQCDNQPGYIDMNCECCNQGQGQPSTSGVGVNTSPPGMTSGGSSGTTSGQMAPNKKKQRPMKKKPLAPSQPIDLKRTIREVINKLKRKK